MLDSSERRILGWFWTEGFGESGFLGKHKLYEDITRICTPE
jgi:hypothetical protein